MTSAEDQWNKDTASTEDQNTTAPTDVSTSTTRKKNEKKYTTTEIARATEQNEKTGDNQRLA